jgi:hypothetical protein
MVNIKLEDNGYGDYHMFGSSNSNNSNDDEAELAVYSLQPLDLADLDENGDFILPLSCRSDNSSSSCKCINMVATSPRRTTQVRKCRSRDFATVSPATTVSTTSHSDIVIQDSFDDCKDKYYDIDNDIRTPKQSPRTKTKTTPTSYYRTFSSPRRSTITYKKSQPPRKTSRSTAATIASASAAAIEEELGYSVQVGKDVLCGRGQKIKVLNEHYRNIIRDNYPTYVATQCDITKREIAKRLWSHIVEENGGRFLDVNGVELNKPMAVLKVMKALKYVRLLTWSFFALLSYFWPFHSYIACSFKQGCQEATGQATFAFDAKDSSCGANHSSGDTSPQTVVFTPS